MIVIAIAFIICWSPLFVVSIVTELQEASFAKRNNFIFVVLICLLCGFSNGCINPIVYMAMSESYRQHFRTILGRLLMCGCTKDIFVPTHSTATRQLSYAFSNMKARLTIVEPNADDQPNLTTRDDKTYCDSTSESGSVRPDYENDTHSTGLLHGNQHLLREEMECQN